MSDEEIIVIGTPFTFIWGSGWSRGSSEGGHFDSPQLLPVTEGGGGTPFAVDCANVNEAADDDVPDNARYFAPAALPDSYYADAVKHIADFSNRTRSFDQVKYEIVRMYTDRNHPHFVDFKDWGTGRGPPGSISGGAYEYFSEAAGQPVVSNAFEAYDNFFFGVVCTFAGFSSLATQISAAVSQEGGGPRDDPRDRPHVNAGIVRAQRFLILSKDDPSNAEPVTVFGQGCKEGVQ